MNKYIVKISSAKMPTTCKGKYIRVAVILTKDGTIPTMISERAKGVIKIVKIWENCSVGKTAKCASARAICEAKALAHKLNNC